MGLYEQGVALYFEMTSQYLIELDKKYKKAQKKNMKLVL